MLRVIQQPNKLPYSAIMEIYAESLAAAAVRDYPRLSAKQALFRAEQEFYAYLYHDFFSAADAACFLWEVDGCYVAAVRLEAYADGLLVTGLETRPDMRGRGYAKRLLSAVLDDVRAQYNGPLYSHISKENAPSLAVHRACGFEIILDHAVCLDGSVERGMYTLCTGVSQNLRLSRRLD